MASTHDIQQSDDQFLAVTDAMEAVSEVIENNVTDMMLYINIGSTRSDAVAGGYVTPEAISKAQALLDEIRKRQGMTSTTGVLHCWQ